MNGRQQGDAHEADAEADERGDERQAHGDDRAEGEQQDDDGDGQPDELGRCRLGHFVGRHDAAAELDLEARGLDRLDFGDELLVGGLGDGLRVDLVLDGDEGDGAVVGDGAGRDRVGGSQHLGEGAEVGADLGQLVGVERRSVNGGDDHADGVAGLGGEALLEEVDRLLGLGAGDGELGGRLAAGRLGDDAEQDEPDEPAGQHPAAIANAEVSESVEQCCHDESFSGGFGRPRVGGHDTMKCREPQRFLGTRTGDRSDVGSQPSIVGEDASAAARHASVVGLRKRQQLQRGRPPARRRAAVRPVRRVWPR